MKKIRIIALLAAFALVLTQGTSVFAATKKEPGPLSEATLNFQQEITITVGEKLQLEYSVEPAIEGTVKQKWSSSSSKIASVNSNGILNAKKVGKVKITLTLSMTGFTATKKAVCVVQVVKKAAVPAPSKSPVAPLVTPSPPIIPTPNANYDNSALIVIDLVNSVRAQYGLAAYKIDDGLMQAAKLRASEITMSFSHTRPDGTSCSTAVPYKNTSENIGYCDSDNGERYIMDMWMESEGHRNNILKTTRTHIGVAVVYSGDRAYWVQIFAKI